MNHDKHIPSNAMSPALCHKALSTMHDIRQPVFLWGAPGVGKSQVVAQVAAEKGIQLVDLRAVLLDPVDLRGIPTINDQRKAEWAIADFLPTEGEGILFLDELNAAPNSTAAACYQLVLDRALGEYKLPDGWSVFAAGNRETDRAVTSRMPSALANRFVHVEFSIDNDDWTRWALQNGIATEVIAFLRFRPELLHQFDPKANSKAFPTPRSWEFVSRIVLSGVDRAALFPLIAGTIGEGAAAEFYGFLKVFKELPDVDALLRNPDGITYPKDPATLYALSSAVSKRANDMNMASVVKYAQIVPPEFGVVTMFDATQRDPSLCKTRAYIEWASDESNGIN